MRLIPTYVVLTAMLLSACGIGSDSPAPAATSPSTPTSPSPTQPDTSARTPWQQPVPKAVCGANDVPETGLQGQVPITERLVGFDGYRCNLELVSQVQGEGAGWQHAWFEDCSYFGTANGDGQVNPGVVVIDAKDSANPKIAGHLATQGMLDPWESLKVNEKRKLLADIDSAGGGGTNFIDIYDLSGGCAQPKLLVSKAVPGSTMAGHAGNFAPDGMTYYGSSNPDLHALDISDPTNPTLITEGSATLPIGSHDLSASNDGNRLYLTNLGLGLPENNINGLVILDSTEIQQRKPNPKATIVSEFYWPDGAGAQMTQRISVGGRPFILFVDEGISSANKQFFCSQGLSPFAFARLIDISDEKNPKLAAKLMLETHDPAHCAMTLNDSQSAAFGYDSHYCTAFNAQGDTGTNPVDDVELIICGYFESGLRVFDVRDPYLPREIAYYNPPAQVMKQNSLPGSNHLGVKNVDWTASHPRLRADRGEIWFTSQDNGFQIVKFTNGVFPLKPLTMTSTSPTVSAVASTVETAPASSKDGNFGGAMMPSWSLMLLGLFSLTLHAAGHRPRPGKGGHRRTRRS